MHTNNIRGRSFDMTDRHTPSILFFSHFLSSVFCLVVGTTPCTPTVLGQLLRHDRLPGCGQGTQNILPLWEGHGPFSLASPQRDSASCRKGCLPLHPEGMGDLPRGAYRAAASVAGSVGGSVGGSASSSVRERGLAESDVAADVGRSRGAGRHKRDPGRRLRRWALGLRFHTSLPTGARKPSEQGRGEH